MQTLREWIGWAEEKRVALGHFNISDSEGFKAIVESAQELKLPVVVGVSEGERDFIGVDTVVAMIKTAKEDSLPIYLNADHSYSFDRVKEAVDAGFDAVIIDGSALPFQENVELTKKSVAYAKSVNKDILVEGELGFIGRSSKILERVPDGVSEETQTKPEEASHFGEETGVDLLAPSVGNVHGIVKTGNPKLNIGRIKAIRDAVSVPLVLHGGSGLKDEEFVEAIKAGVRIVHINTEIRLAYKEGIEDGIESEEVAPYKFMLPGVEEMKKVIIDKLKLFNGML